MEQAREDDDRRGAPAGDIRRRLQRWLAGLVQRPFRVEWQGWRLRFTRADRRRRLSPDHPRSLAPLRQELAQQLAEVAHTQAAEVLLPLRVVHHELGRRGWSGVETLPSRVIAKALTQAELMAGPGQARTLAPLVDRLRLLKAAAEVREERKAALKAREDSRHIEVSEATEEEFAEMERSWVGVMPTEEPVDGGSKR